MGEFAIRNVLCKANRDSQRDSGQKRRKHVGSPQFAESGVLAEFPVDCFFQDHPAFAPLFFNGV